MKNIALWMGVLLSTSAWSCDVCGCRPMPGASWIGQTYATSVSLGYRQTVFHSTHAPLFGSGEYSRSRELFRSTQIGLNYGWNRWAFSAQIPFVLNQYELEGSTENTAQIGDISVGASYALLPPSEDSPWRWDLNAGIKLPTGPWQLNTASYLPAAIQPGTGSWDFNAGMDVFWLHSDIWQSAISLQSRINTRNPEGIRFGSSGYLDLREYVRLINSENGALRAEFAYRWWMDAGDTDGPNRPVVEGTSGQFHSLRTSLGYSYKNVLFTAGTDLPIYQNFSDGAVQAEPSVYFNLTFKFSSES